VYYALGCVVVYCGTSSGTFRSNILPLFSKSKNMRSKQLLSLCLLLVHCLLDLHLNPDEGSTFLRNISKLSCGYITALSIFSLHEAE
jgi:hypothetical protein